VKATPKAKKTAEELGVALAAASGTGPQGGITASDVEAAAADTGTAQRTVREERELSRMRSTIADRLGELPRGRPRHRRPRGGRRSRLRGDRQLCGLAHRRHPPVCLRDARGAPEFNATYDADAETLTLYEEHNVGVAIDIEGGLVTPVLPDVGGLSVAEINAARGRVTERVLDGEYTSDDLSGGTFTVSNLGVFGSDSFTPIINPPEVAILGLNRVTERAVQVENGIAFHRHMTFSLSFDHRVVDGADAAKFLTTLESHLESARNSPGSERDRARRRLTRTHGLCGWPCDRSPGLCQHFSRTRRQSSRARPAASGGPSHSGSPKRAPTSSSRTSTRRPRGGHPDPQADRRDNRPGRVVRRVRRHRPRGPLGGRRGGRAFGGIDVMVNNAGIVNVEDVLEVTEAEYDAVMDVNAKGTFFGAQRAARAMDDGGVIINMSSIAGLEGTGDYVTYSTSKGAVRLMTYSLADALGPMGIRVNAIHPGPVDTGLMREDLGTDPDAENPFVQNVPGGGWAPRRTSRTPPSTSRATSRTSSLGRRSSSTAACTPPGETALRVSVDITDSAMLLPRHCHLLV